VDITPFVGILGAIVGGSIGLFGQRMNLREQRRKELRERVVDFLRAADRIVDLTFGSERPDLEQDPTAAKEARERLDALFENFHDTTQHLELIAPSGLGRRVDALSTALFAAGALGVKTGKTKDDKLALSSAMKTYYLERRNVVHYLRPGLGRGSNRKVS